MFWAGVVEEEDLCYAAIEGYGNECDGEECCLAQSTAGFLELWATCSAFVTVDMFTWLDPAFVDPATAADYAATNNCDTYVLECPAVEVTAFYSRKHELLAGDCCAEDADCAAGLLCDTTRRVCTATCSPGTGAVGISVGTSAGGGCADRPTTTVGFDQPFPTCSAATGSDAGVCDMENRCEVSTPTAASDASGRTGGP